MINELKDLSFLELFILNTITYFDVFDYPLTLNEVYTYLYTGGMEGSNYSLEEISETLETSEKLNKIITTQGGFYFLKGREEIIQTRLDHYNLADKKFKIALRAIKLLKYCPGIKMIAACNNLAYFNAAPESDIDLFIITAKNRLYFTRLIVTLIVSLLGLRRHGNKITDRLCLSFYLAEDNLNLEKIKIAADDIYLIYWLATLYPIYQRENFYQKLINNNQWFTRYLPNWLPRKISYRFRVEDNKWSIKAYKVKEFFLNSFLGAWLEKLSLKFQLAKMSPDKKEIAASKKNWVIISDKMLKFHEKDRRAKYLEEFENKRKKLLDEI